MMRVLLASLLLLASPFALAQTPAERVEEFLRQVGTAKADEAFDRIFEGSGFAELKPQEFTTLKSQTRMAMGLYGTVLGVEKVREEDLSPSLKRLVYLQKFEQYPVAWEFYFYKPKDTWQVNSLNFKDQISGLVGAKQ